MNERDSDNPHTLDAETERAELRFAWALFRMQSHMYHITGDPEWYYPRALTGPQS